MQGSLDTIIFMHEATGVWMFNSTMAILKLVASLGDFISIYSSTTMKVEVDYCRNKDNIRIIIRECTLRDGNPFPR